MRGSGYYDLLYGFINRRGISQKECYNPIMLEDDPDPFDPYDPGEYDIVEASVRSTRNCLFSAITLLLVVSLAGSSLMAYFLWMHRGSQSDSGRVEAIVVEPTAAPATVMASVPTPAASRELENAGPAFEVNRIAVINNDGQLETMAPDGSDRRVLTLASDNTSFQFPAWAPDSRRVAVIGSKPAGSGIYVLDDTTSAGALNDHRIYFNADRAPLYLFWAPDGARLAFLADHPLSTMSLNVIADDGADAGRLLATGAPFYWDWSEDGQRLLIHSGGERSRETLSLIDLEGTTQANNLAVPGHFRAPGIGQGGQYWAFAEQIDGGLSALVVVNTATGERTTYDQSGSMAISWNPKRSQIAFTRGAIDGYPYWGPLQLLDIETGETRILSRQTVLAFFWSPDGRSIAFITPGRDNGGDGVNASAPRASMAGRVGSLPVQQFGRGFLTLSVIDADTGRGLRLLDFEPTIVYLSQFLPFFDQYALSHRIWSPDSSSIVLPVREADGDVILVIPTAGGRPHRLADGEIAFWSHK